MAYVGCMARPAPVAEPVVEAPPETVYPCHAMVRVEGGWRRFVASNPESVRAKYASHISDVHDYGTLIRQLDKALYLQREKG